MGSSRTSSSHRHACIVFLLLQSAQVTWNYLFWNLISEYICESPIRTSKSERFEKFITQHPSAK